jgi:hypothetical protein
LDINDAEGADGNKLLGGFAPSARCCRFRNDAQVGDSLHDRGALIMDAQALYERLILL